MKKIIAYFSASGVTKEKAIELAKATGADLYEIVPLDPYTHADLDWTNRTSRCTAEMQNPESRPALTDEKINLSDYDTVYIGFPVWWGIAPRIISTFIESNDFTGKKIVLFATSGGSKIDPAMKDLKDRYPKLDIIGGKMLKDKVTGDII